MIRQMTESDVPAVFSITCESMDQYFSPEVFSYFRIQWPAGQLVYCDMLGNVRGYISGARLDRGRVSISLFAVDEKIRNTGAGSELLAFFRQRAAMEGFATIQLEVRPANTVAVEFYEKRGFMKTEFMRFFYNDGGDAIRMIGPVLMNV